MRNYIMNSKAIRLGLAAGVVSLMVGCNSANQTDATGADSLNQDSTSKKPVVVEKAKKVMYNLPSPIETSMLLKSAGATYNAALLNPAGNASKYTTNFKMAVNMGVYGTDMSYASIFEQKQATMQYMAASKKLADQLGLLNSIDASIQKRLEANVNNRDSVMFIISETFLNSNSSLQEDDRPAVAAVILAGGWVEGLYLATSMVKSVEKKDLVARIVDQKLSFADMVSLLEMYKDNADVQQIIGKLDGIKKAFDAIQYEKSKTEAVTDQATHTTVLKATATHNITQPQFEALKKAAAELRAEFVK